MLVKLIRCEVPVDRCERSALGQEAWGALSTVDGFAGQIGGWDVSDSTRAVIVGFWRDDEAYGRFMDNIHDAIFAAHGQQGSYASSDVTLWQRELDIPGSSGSIANAITQAGLIRMVLCELKPGRRNHFVQIQRDIWNPGMAASGGLLDGAFSRHCDDEDRFSVCSLWRSESDHQRYRETEFHECRRAAHVEDDCASVTGMVVRCESSWKVVPARI